MAHANPEFALGLMHRDNAPVSTQLDKPASLAQLRARMIEIGELIRIDYPVDDAEREAYWLWHRVARQSRTELASARRLQAAISEPPGGGMHGGDPDGVRFIEPKRRVHPNVQAGRTKPRRGTLAR